MANSVLHSPKNPHFFQPLLPGFHSHLSIPLKFFSEYIEGIYDNNTVELESDACESTWKVKMEGRRLTVGWKEFAIAHDFRIGDIIIFRHEGDLVFHVTSFGPSCCEFWTSAESKRVSIKHSNKEKKRKTGESSQRMPSSSSSPSSLGENRFVTLTVKPNDLLKCRLYLPRRFTKENKMEKARGKKISFLDKSGVEWPVRVTTDLRLGSGFKKFLEANGVKAYESFVLEFVWEDRTNPPMFKFCSKIKT